MKQQIKLFLVLQLILILSLVYFTACAPENKPTTNGVADLIFTDENKSMGNIYRLDSQTQEVSTLTQEKDNYISLAWSPDKKYIAYTRSYESTFETYIMNQDGSNKHQVKGTTALDKVCGWSPDGKYLLLTSCRDIDQEIYCLELESGLVRNLSLNTADDDLPVWSPDGKKIAYVSDRGNEDWHPIYDLYVLYLSTGELCKVDTGTKSVRDIVWSPNSEDLAITLEDMSYNSAVYITDIHSSKLDKINKKSRNTHPIHWSDDGNSILMDQIEYDNGWIHDIYWYNIKDESIKEFTFESDYQIRSLSLGSSEGTTPPLGNIKNHRQVAGPQENIALINATLIDGNGGEPIQEARVLIKDGVITYAGPKKIGQELLDDYKVVDLDDKYILPGLINAHVHFGYSAYQLREWAKHGVTTVRDLGADLNRPLFQMRDNINSRPELARVIMVGPMMTVPHGYPEGPWALRVTSVEDARDKTLDLIEKGVDVIKVALESGEPFQKSFALLSLEELTMIVDTAHSKCVKVTAHVSVSNSSHIETAITAGVDDIAHNWMTPVNPDFFQKMIDKKMYLVPTQEVLQYNYTVTEENLKTYYNMGGLVAMGSDYGGDPFHREMDLGIPLLEIQSMENSGMSASDIIVASTKNAAIVCGQDNTIGTVEKGKKADLLILHDNPLDKIDNLMSTHMVIKDGVIIAQ